MPAVEVVGVGAKEKACERKTERQTRLIASLNGDESDGRDDLMVPQLCDCKKYLSRAGLSTASSDVF